LSQKVYIEKVLERFRMSNYALLIERIVKVNKFNKNQCPQNILENEQMSNIPCAFIVGSLMYA
jgi:hypothetical protein